MLVQTKQTVKRKLSPSQSPSVKSSWSIVENAKAIFPYVYHILQMLVFLSTASDACPVTLIGWFGHIPMLAFFLMKRHTFNLKQHHEQVSFSGTLKCQSAMYNSHAL